MIKVGFLVYDITRNGGVERVICNLSNLLIATNKYLPNIFSISSFSRRPFYEIDQRISIHHLGKNIARNILKRVLQYITLVIHLRNIFFYEKIEIVVGTGHGLNMLLVFFKNLKKVASEHVNYMSVPLYSRILRRIVYPFLNKVVVLTYNDAKKYCFCKNINVIPNPVSFSPPRHSGLKNKIILSVGRLTPPKSFDLLIDAIDLIKDKIDGWTLRIIGSGDDERKLLEQINRLKVSHLVKIYPATSHIIDEYINAGLFVLSSRYEGFGLVLIEAQACGLPVISSNCPSGPGEIIKNNENGLLVEPENITAMANAILDLINNEEKRRFFAKNALKNVDRYRPENIYSLWDKLFSSLR
jgi:glycosyltransferase involved in cell wall biosynthesis